MIEMVLKMYRWNALGKMSSYMHWSFSHKFSLFAADGDTVQSNCFKLERNIDNH